MNTVTSDAGGALAAVTTDVPSLLSGTVNALSPVLGAVTGTVSGGTGLLGGLLGDL